MRAIKFAELPQKADLPGSPVRTHAAAPNPAPAPSLPTTASTVLPRPTEVEAARAPRK